VFEKTVLRNIFGPKREEVTRDCKNEIYTFGILRSIEWYFQWTFQESLSVPSSRVLNCLTLEDRIDRLS
jgi:hypothetical protein